MSRVERHKNEYGAGDSRAQAGSGSAARILGRLLGAAGTLIMIAAVIIGLSMTVPRLFGIQQYVVISGSMEPSIPVGSIVYASKTDPAELAEGDVIVFFRSESETTPVTHRVIENNVSDGEVITKGDANEQKDLAPIKYPDIIGKVRLHIPKLGYIASPLGSPLGKAGALLVVAGAYLLTVIGAKLRG